MFSFGVLATLLEIHLLDFDVSHLFIALCFVLEGTVYLIIALTTGSLLKNLDERTIMVFGALTFTIAYLMLGPCSYIFPKNVYIVIASLPLFGVGQILTYSIFYLVFSIPYMLRSANLDYGYNDDDILTDIISSFAVIGAGVGELLGPLFSGFLSEGIGIEHCCTIAALMTFAFGIVFAIGTGIIPEWFKKEKKHIKKEALPLNDSLENKTN